MVLGPQRLPVSPRSIYNQWQQATMLQVPRFFAPTPAFDPLLIQATSMFAFHLNRVVSYGIQLNLDAPLDARPIESINSSVGSMRKRIKIKRSSNLFRALGLGFVVLFYCCLVATLVFLFKFMF